jgi:hypothetical protein
MLRKIYTDIKSFALTAMLIMAMLITFLPNSKAQFYNGSQLTFGKNRVQYKNFIWNYYRFSDFDTYFYLNGAPLAQHCAKYAREQLRNLESMMQNNLDGKIQFVIFNTLTDLKESNLGLLSNEKYNIGGITHILGRKVLLYFDGDYANFDKQIRAGIAKVLLDQLMYGVSVGTQVKNNALSNYPEWYVNGMISYLSEEWSTSLDNFVKDALMTKKLKHLNTLKETDAVYAGHSLWKYIADKYGKNVIPAIIYSSRMSKKVQGGFTSELGLKLRELEKQWLEYLTNRYKADDADRADVPKTLLLPHPKIQRKYERLRLSPDGKREAYITNEAGKAIIWIYDNTKKKAQRIYSIGHRLDEKVDDTYPLLAWHPTGKVLAVIVERNGFINIDFYTIGKKQIVHKIVYNIDKVLDFSYSSDGLNFVMSAIQKGWSDIFVYNIASGSYEQITKDPFNDLTPRFINNSSQIVFSSNRPVDTLAGEKTKYDDVDFNPTNDLFVYNYATRSNKLIRLTNTPLANESHPVEWSSGQVGFLSDESGIRNSYIAGFDSTITAVDTISHYKYFTKLIPGSNLKRGIVDFDANAASGKVAKIIFSDGRYRMSVEPMLEPHETEVANPAPTNYMAAMQKLPPDVLKSSLERRPKAHRRLTNVTEKEIPKVKDTVLNIQNQRLRRDTTRYSFSRSAILAISSHDSLFKQKFPAIYSLVQLDTTHSTAPIQQRTYNVEYFVNELVSQIDYSNLYASYQPFTGGGGPIYLNPGINALMMVGATDLLEDYRISGGVRLNPDLKNNEYLLSFANLKHRFDKELVFHRSSLEETDGFYTLRHRIHEASFIGTWPFSNVLAIKGTVTLRNDRAIWLASDLPSLMQKDVIKTWGAIKGELTYDNTREIEVNIPQGTRFKVFSEYYYQLNQNGNMISLGLDARHYLRIDRCFIWANRFAAATSFGHDKIIYYMGGVDNWIGAKFNQSIPIDYSQNYAYQTLATNMRGFDQNIRNGNSFMVFNSELRLPVFKYLLNRPTRIGIIDNFQVVGFGDVGTAWSGPNPFLNNILFTRYVNQSPIGVVVREQRNPIVEGMGFGLRTRLLGYFIRADWAWGIEEGAIQPRKFYVSLSLDF